MPTEYAECAECHKKITRKHEAVVVGERGNRTLVHKECGPDPGDNAQLDQFV